MPRKAKSKEIKIVGPLVMVDKEELVGFTTNFSDYGFNKLKAADLQQIALESHQSFMAKLSDKISSVVDASEVKKAKEAK